MKQHQVFKSGLGRVAAGLGGVVLSLSVAGVASADASFAPTSAPQGAALYVLDTTFGDMQNPLYFQVVGQGFRPGEQVTLHASLALPGQSMNQALQLLPVQVLANDYGQVAATLDGGGYVGAGDGFIIRATGDQHNASIVDLALAGASWTAPSGN